MRRILIMSLLLASGCALPANVPSASPVNKANTPVEPLAGVTFRSLAAENTRYAGGVGVPQAAVQPTSVSIAMPVPAVYPSAPPASGPYPGQPFLPPAQPDGLFSGNMNGGYYGFGPSYGGGGAPTALVSITQAETTGSQGPYRQMMATVVTPVVKAWAADAQLITSNGNTGSDGLLTGSSPSPIPSCAPVYYGQDQQNGWNLVYYSAARGEMLNFTVAQAKTLIVRTRWAPMDLSAPIAVDNDAALQGLITAIKTQGVKSEEEKSGKDYFLGSPYSATNGMCFGPVASGPNHTETVYDVPADARWNTSLQMMLGKPVWQLNFYANGQKDTYQQGFYFNNSANGMVDATTGAVIRFGRPSKQFFGTPDPNQGPYPIKGGPMPMPSLMPSPAPTTTPSPAPTTEVTQ
ncbi:MAG: hypothetical protein JWM80_3265 [Cyanobacteria bacterium RYN_339]|nr:hypothetical protein [Cyanobacteria bacterium RYN_339]